MTSFIDTNILVYAQQSGSRGDRARALLADGGVVSVQVLNEFENVCRRTLRLGWDETLDALSDLRDALDPPVSLTVDTHEAALVLSRSHGLPICDALIVAAALEAGCATLYSEDFQDGRRFGALVATNPFRGLADPA